MQDRKVPLSEPHVRVPSPRSSAGHEIVESAATRRAGDLPGSVVPSIPTGYAGRAVQSDSWFGGNQARSRVCSEMGCSHGCPSSGGRAYACEASHRSRQSHRTATRQMFIREAVTGLREAVPLANASGSQEDLIIFEAQATVTRCRGEVRLVLAPDPAQGSARALPSLIKAVARAHNWVERIARGEVPHQRAIAAETASIGDMSAESCRWHSSHPISPRPFWKANNLPI